MLKYCQLQVRLPLRASLYPAIFQPFPSNFKKIILKKKKKQKKGCSQLTIFSKLNPLSFFNPPHIPFSPPYSFTLF